jgi:hypothetical protein
VSAALEHAEAQNAALDALGAILAAERGDVEAASTMVNAVAAAGELSTFAVAAVGHAGHALRLASNASGIPVETIAGAIAHMIRETKA